MITLNQKQELILKFHREGKSQRTIEKETGISRKTISRYIVKYETDRQELLLSTENSNRIDQIDLITNLVEAPKYQVSNRGKRKLTEEMVDKIKYYLEENELKNKTNRLSSKRRLLIFIKPYWLQAIKLATLLCAIP